MRRDGRGLYGARVTDHAPDGRWHTTTFLTALRMAGLTAPAVFAGRLRAYEIRFSSYARQAS